MIAVVLFHFKPAWLSGGFAGVDVFFVISGFLMTGIILRGIEQDNFSILKFYVARANRIIPALAVLCLALLVFGWFYLTPLDYKTLGKHAAGSIGFLSNVLYLRESGYFDASSLEKWLLHTWSLSVEWQFYIIYPLILISVRKLFSIQAIKPVVLLGTVLSFILCIYATYQWPTAAYYLLPTRAWEMMIGGVAYLYPLKAKENQKRVLEVVGLLLIVLSYVFVSSETPWPGYIALFPVLGSFLIIQAQRNNSLFTGNFIFQKLGLWSYSIYLWHWPLVVAIYYFSLDVMYIYIGVVFSVLLGFLSYKYIERIRFNNYGASFFSLLKCKPLYFSMVLGVLGGYITLSNGLDLRFRLSPEVDALKSQLVMPLRENGYCFYSFTGRGSNKVDKDIGVNCSLGSKNEKSTTLLFGDSFAGHNEPFFDEVFKSKNLSFKSVVTNWCVPSLTDRFTGPKTSLSYNQCLLNREYLKENMHNYKNVIFAGSWGSVLSKGQIDDVKSVIESAANKGINVFVMAAPYAYSKNPLKDFYQSIYFDKKANYEYLGNGDEVTNKANLYLREISQNYSNVYFIDRDLLYRESNTFDVYGLVIPYSLDGGHISMLGSKNSAKYFMQHPEYDMVMSRFEF